MAISKTPITVQAAATSVAAGTVRATPVASASIDCRSYYGGDINYIITNGATAPTVAVTVVFQASSDNGANWYDYYTVGGDLVASSVNTGTIPLDPGIMYLRQISFGNTVQPVTVGSILQAITAL